MISSTVEINDIKDICKIISTENKKYAIAVANALLFSEGQINQQRNPTKQAIQQGKQLQEA